MKLCVKSSRTGKKVHARRSKETTVCGLYIGPSYDITDEKVTCLSCLNGLDKIRKEKEIKEKWRYKRKIIIIVLDDDTSTALDYYMVLEGKHQASTEQIITAVCSNWSYWTTHEIVRKDIKCVYTAMIDCCSPHTTLWTTHIAVDNKRITCLECLTKLNTKEQAIETASTLKKEKITMEHKNNAGNIKNKNSGKVHACYRLHFTHCGIQISPGWSKTDEEVTCLNCLDGLNTEEKSASNKGTTPITEPEAPQTKSKPRKTDKYLSAYNIATMIHRLHEKTMQQWAVEFNVSYSTITRNVRKVRKESTLFCPCTTTIKEAVRLVNEYRKEGANSND